MSGIAGIIHLDGAPLEPGQIERMTSAMAHRGPDGIHHWVKHNVALGQCMLHTTPESLEETQPLTNEDGSLVLVMDGRVDNREELRRELLGRGAVLRSCTDAELVLRAYEAWGEACPDRIIGEYVFFIWDVRQRRLFAARDAAGTRHFYYHTGKGWFAFASEIKGLLALGRIGTRLNESRVLDYLVPEFDRDDVIGTFYQDIYRMPAGHAMTVSGYGVKTWRYWNPDDLPERRFASLDECAEAFLEQMRIAVKCRLRSIGPVGAMLSGGLDSSSIVGLIRKEFRGELSQPLQTFSLIREDSENCPDWNSIQQILKGGWVDPTIINSTIAGYICKPYLDDIQYSDEPFAFSHGLNYSLVYRAAREKGCRVVFDGMAGDSLFYGPDRTLDTIFKRKLFSLIPSMLIAYHRHQVENGLQLLVRKTLVSISPKMVKAIYRKRRNKRGVLEDDSILLRRDVARQFLSAKREQHGRAEEKYFLGSDQSHHAKNFTGGMISFAHEVYGQIAFSEGVEQRSPFSDRRLIEFAIQMPLKSKLFLQWYKPVLRDVAKDILPENVRLRPDRGGHPGWQFYEQLIAGMPQGTPDVWNFLQINSNLHKWVDPKKLSQAWNQYERSNDYHLGYKIYSLAIIAHWVRTKRLDS